MMENNDLKELINIFLEKNNLKIKSWKRLGFIEKSHLSQSEN